MSIHEKYRHLNWLFAKIENLTQAILSISVAFYSVWNSKLIYAGLVVLTSIIAYVRGAVYAGKKRSRSGLIPDVIDLDLCSHWISQPSEESAFLPKPANTIHWPIVCLTLGHHRKPCPSVKPTLGSTSRVSWEPSLQHYLGHTFCVWISFTTITDRLEISSCFFSRS